MKLSLETAETNVVGSNFLNTITNSGCTNICTTVNDVYGKAVYNTSEKNIEILDYKILVPDKVIRVNFTDKKSEKLVCDKEDIFDLRNGLFIALAKHLYKNTYTLEGIELKAKEFSYTKKYIKMIDKVIRNHNKKIEEEKIVKEKEKEEKRLAHERRMKNNKRKREYKIEIQKEAYLRALKEFQNGK